MWLIVFSAVCFMYWVWWKYVQRTDPPTYPGFLPVIGHVHHVIGDSTYLWTAVQKLVYYSLSKGGVITFWAGPQRVYIITDPDDCFTVANTCLEKDTLLYKVSKPLFGDGVFTAPVPIWKPRRKLLNPAFSQQVLDGFIDVFNNQARRLVQKLSVEVDNGPFDTLNYFRENSLQTICLTAMGIDIEEDNKLNTQYVKAIDQTLKYFIERYQKFWLRSDIIFKYSALKRRQDECLTIIYDMTNTVLQKKKAVRRNEYYEANKRVYLGEKMKPLIDILLDLEGQFTDKEIRDEINTLIMAGYENTSTVLMFTLILIGSYPEVQEKLYTELQKYFDKNIGVLKQDLSSFIYLDAVLKESMRYYATAPAILRYIDKDVKLKNCTLRAGHNCTIMIHGVHRHSIWGADVEEFRPERWLDSTLPANANAYVAFGAGRRNCIDALLLPRTMMVASYKSVPATIPFEMQEMLHARNKYGGDTFPVELHWFYYLRKGIKPKKFQRNHRYTYFYLVTQVMRAVFSFKGFGRTFAMMAMKITLVHLLANYKISGDHKQIKLKLDSVLKPASGHHIVLKRR